MMLIYIVSGGGNKKWEMRKMCLNIVTWPWHPTCWDDGWEGGRRREEGGVEMLPLLLLTRWEYKIVQSRAELRWCWGHISPSSYHDPRTAVVQNYSRQNITMQAQHVILNLNKTFLLLHCQRQLSQTKNIAVLGLLLERSEGG